MKHNITLALALTAALAAQAQNLSTEVKVDRTVVPAERPAERLGSVHPGIVSVPVSARRLDIAEYGGDGTITRSARLLAPAAWGDTFDISRYRGYVSAGYFPAYNAAVSAGYRIIQNATTRLGAWAQFDGYSFKRELPHLLKDRFSNNTFAIGVDFDHRVRNTGVLNLKFATNYGRLEAPTGYSAGKHDIGMTDLSAAWWARAGRVGYHVGASFHRFGFDEDKDNDLLWDGPAPSRILHTDGAEILFGATAGLTFRTGNDRGRAGLEVKADFLSRPDASTLAATDADNPGHLDVVSAEGSTLGVVSLTPYYAFGRGRGVDLRLGARVDISTGGTGKKFHIAPDVTLTYSADAATVYVRATGGEVLNTQRSLYAYTPFFPVGWQYERSHMPLNVEGGFNLGPWSGFSAEVFGGWARANDWLMPTLTAVGAGTELTVMRPVDLKGAHAGLRLSYAWRSMVDVRASVEMAPQKEGSGYYLWRDRAKLVVKADATVRPIKALELTAGYEFRQSRAAYAYAPDGTASLLSLGCKSDLTFGARYDITPAISVFARGENLLGRKCLALPGVPEQGIHGLVGASFKF